MTNIQKLQARHNKVMKNRKKGKVGIKFMTAEEKHNQFMETIGDRYASRVRSEELTKKWKKENKKGA
jgi:hypothetical protein